MRATYSYVVGLTLMVVGAALAPFVMIGMLGFVAIAVGLVYLLAGVVATRAPDIRTSFLAGGLAVGVVGALALAYTSVVAATVGVRWVGGANNHFPQLDTAAQICRLAASILPAATLAASARMRSNCSARACITLAVAIALTGPFTAIVTMALASYLPTTA